MSTEETTPADAWGQSISAERQAELQGYLDRWQTELDHGRRTGPFDRSDDATHVRLSGSDVFWLAKPSIGAGEIGVLENLHLEGADLFRAQLKGAYLIEARLEGVNLSDAQLQGADLRNARLEGSSLSDAQLQGARLGGARLGGADLSGAQLKGADLSGAQLAGADLTTASFDKTSRLNDAVLIGASLDQVTFDNTNLSVVDWKLVPVLGDELRAQTSKARDGKRKTRTQRIQEYKAAARAYRRLSVALQANGLSEEASEYLYRAQIMQRRLAWRERRLGAYLFSALLAVLAGYGYRLWRIGVSYLSAVALFALAYLTARFFAGTVIDWRQVGEAAQISLNAIHGRVFFAQFALDTAQSWIATVESVVGIVIEGVFVAMLIQRFFGK